ncbi:hypothetical protein Nepgr_011841 [Nepenthes gracilis]|uniref:Uncharacterized protein n=1 Tax=Nepenthes gracilis TaxID=150966 RepID=A0AAD3SFU2_NEPGR|nr:hypothetical protein Nepgr_011841 [Nepenthes gracilis]
MNSSPELNAIADRDACRLVCSVELYATDSFASFVKIKASGRSPTNSREALANNLRILVVPCSQESIPMTVIMSSLRVSLKSDWMLHVIIFGI